MRWADLIRQIPHSHYLELSPEVLLESNRRWMEAIIKVIRTGNYDEAENVIEAISKQRLLQGFDIQEVVQAILLAQDAAFPVILSVFEPCSPEGSQVYMEYNACIRTIVGRFGHWYAGEMNSSLREQQQRTRLILDAAQASSRSLELDRVMEQVARGLLSAVGLAQCRITLADSSRSVLVKADGPLGEQAQNGSLATFALPLETNGQVLGTVELGVPHSRQNPESPVLPASDMKLAFDIVRAGTLSIENARLYEETRRRLAESQSLQKVTAALLQKLSSSEVLQIVCREAMQLTSAAGSAVFYLEENKQRLRVAETAGTQTTAFDELPVDGSFTGMAVRASAPLLTNHPEVEPHMYNGDIPLSAILAAPLRVQGDIIGVLDVVNKPGGFTGDDIRVISLFADQAAIAIESARLNQQVEHIAVMEERNRIARELHDSVTQSLYGVTLYAEAAGRLLSGGDVNGASDYLKDLRNTAQDALKEMRLLIYELRPPVLEQEGLAAALQARLDAVEGRAGLETELKVWGEGRLPPAIEEGFYRIGQEALNNALKHSHAHRIVVALHYNQPTTELEVSDDGVGFELTVVREKCGGFGLKGMQERAAQFGGKLNIESEPGKGTRVRVEASLPPSATGTGDL